MPKEFQNAHGMTVRAGEDHRKAMTYFSSSNIITNFWMA
jgi:hypothetical protein